MNRRFTMPFGKYKGLPIDEIPEDYLMWLLDQDWLKSHIRNTIEEYLYGGDDSNAQWEEGWTAGWNAHQKAREHAQANGLGVNGWPALESGERGDVEKMLKLGFKALVLKYHPDTGGRNDDMQRLNRVAEKLKREGWL